MASDLEEHGDHPVGDIKSQLDMWVWSLRAGSLEATQGCDQHKDQHLLIRVGEASLGKKIKVEQTL